jgi:hypothetical protein
VVGRSAAMMSGYHGRPELTREAEWFSPEGLRFIRTGDVGRFDADGFPHPVDRRKDMIISGGFNLYPSDLEAELRRHPAVHDVAVVGVPSAEWGETPVAFVERRAGDATEAETLRQWLNARVGMMTSAPAARVGCRIVSSARQWLELPRSAIGKVLKRELRTAWGSAAGELKPPGAVVAYVMASSRPGMQMVQMRHRLAGGQAQHLAARVDGAREQGAEQVDHALGARPGCGASAAGPWRGRRPGGPAAHAGRGRVAVRRQHEQAVGQVARSCAIDASHSPSGSASGSVGNTETFDEMRGSTWSPEIISPSSSQTRQACSGEWPRPTTTRQSCGRRW